MPTPEQLETAKQYYSEDEIKQYLGQLESEKKTARAPYEKMLEAPGGGRGVVYQEPERPAEYEKFREDAGAPFMDRFMASFKTTPQERLDFYKKRMGPENVMTTPGGEILFKKNGAWKSIEEKGLGVGDIADLAGDSPEMAGMLAAGGPVGASILKAGLYAGGGNMLKQLMGIMLPGEASIHPGEVASSAALGSVSQAMGGAGSVNPVKMAGAPLNAAAEAYLSRRAKKLGTTDVAAEGRDLMEKTGFPLNLAEETQDPWAKMILGFAYRNAYGQELAALDQKAKDTAALSMFKRLSGKLGQAGGFESKDFSEAAVKAGQASVKDIEDSLQKNSTEKFGFLNRPDAAVNDIPLANRNALLDREAQYYASMGTPDALRTAEGLRKMMAAPSTTNGVATGNARLVQKEMQEFGEEGYGRFGEDFYKNLSRAEQGRLSRSIWGALRKDLGAAAEGGNAKAQQLLEARKGTEELLSLRERLKEVPLIKLMESKGMLNKALTNEGFVGQEAIGKELLGGMKSGSITPSEISNMTKLMQAVNPGFHHDLARAVIDNAVQVGKAAGKTRPAGFSYADAAKALPSPEYLQAIYKDIWSPEGKSTGMKIHSDLTLLLKAIERAERVGQGIPHAPGTTVLGIMDNLMGGEFKSAAKQFAGQIYFPRKVGQIAMSKAAEMKAVADALKQKETGAPKQHFLRSYIGEQLPRVLPPAMYEVGAALPRSNRPEVGE